MVSKSNQPRQILNVLPKGYPIVGIADITCHLDGSIELVNRTTSYASQIHCENFEKQVSILPVDVIIPSLEADLNVGVMAGVSKSKEQGSLIGMDLLVIVFIDPILIVKLINGAIVSTNIDHSSTHLVIDSIQGHVLVFNMDGSTLLYQIHIVSEISAGIVSLQFITCSLLGLETNILVV